MAASHCDMFLNTLPLIEIQYRLWSGEVLVPVYFILVYRQRVDRTDERTYRGLYAWVACMRSNLKIKSCFYGMPVRAVYIPHIFPFICILGMSDRDASNFEISFQVYISLSVSLRSIMFVPVLKVYAL